MPYRIEKRGDEWAVVGPGGKVFGRHSSPKKAKAQVAALYIHVKEADVDDIVDHLLGERRPILTQRTFRRTLKRWLETKNKIDELAALVKELREKNEPLVERLIPVVATLQDQKVRVDEGIVALRQRTSPQYQDAFAYAVQRLEELGLDKVAAQCQRHKRKLDQVRSHLVLYRRGTEEVSWWSRLTEWVKDIAGRLWSFVKGWEPKVAAFEEAVQFMEPDEGAVEEIMDAPETKEIWQMTFDEYKDQPQYVGTSKPEIGTYKVMLQRALAKGKPVPRALLQRYGIEIFRVEREMWTRTGTITIQAGPDLDAESGWSVDPDDLPAEVLGIIQKTYLDDDPDHDYQFDIKLASSQRVGWEEPETAVLGIEVQLPDGTRHPVKNWALYDALEQWALENAEQQAMWREPEYEYAEGGGVEHLVDELLTAGEEEGD